MRHSVYWILLLVAVLLLGWLCHPRERTVFRFHPPDTVVVRETVVVQRPRRRLVLRDTVRQVVYLDTLRLDTLGYITLSDTLRGDSLSPRRYGVHLTLPAWKSVPTIPQPEPGLPRWWGRSRLSLQPSGDIQLGGAVFRRLGRHTLLGADLQLSPLTGEWQASFEIIYPLRR